jgi:hypothetical protein
MAGAPPAAGGARPVMNKPAEILGNRAGQKNSDCCATARLLGIYGIKGFTVIFQCLKDLFKD